MQVATCAAAPTPVYAEAKTTFAQTIAYLSSREALQMRESDLERELHRRGQELIRKLLQGHLDQRGPGEAGRPGRRGRRCRAPGAARARPAPGDDLRHGGCRADGLRARGSRESASAGCVPESAAGALLARGAPSGGRSGRVAVLRRSAVGPVTPYRGPGSQASGGTVGGSRGGGLRRLLPGAPCGGGRAGPRRVGGRAHLRRQGRGAASRRPARGDAQSGRAAASATRAALPVPAPAARGEKALEADGDSGRRLRGSRRSCAAWRSSCRA